MTYDEVRRRAMVEPRNERQGIRDSAATGGSIQLNDSDDCAAELD